MTETDKIKLELEKILQSKEFKDSSNYQRLLSYLVGQTLANNIPKEITIAIDLFDKDTSFTSNRDSTVRYQVHTLRKKLDHYYNNEGKKEKSRLTIPKGRYEIKYVIPKTKFRKKTLEIVSYIRQWEIVTILLLALVSLYFAYLYFNSGRENLIEKETNIFSTGDRIWGSFFQNGNPTQIIMGDDFLLDEYSPKYKRYRQIRDWEIDSEKQLNNFLIKFPKANLSKSEISNFPVLGEKNLIDILPIIFKYSDDVSINYSSKTNLENIRNHNVIYIGEFTNLRVLEKLFYNIPIRFQRFPELQLFILNDNGDTIKTFIRTSATWEQQNDYNVDYSLLIKRPGINNENILLIVGFGYSGRIERTKMLSQPQRYKEFKEKIIEINEIIPEYFMAVFEVESIERTGFSDKLKYFKELHKNNFE